MKKYGMTIEVRTWLEFDDNATKEEMWEALTDEIDNIISNTDYVYDAMKHADLEEVA